MFNLSKLSLRCMQPTSIRTILRNHSTARPTVILKTPLDNATSTSEDTVVSRHSVQKVKEIKSNGLVAAAFASLQQEDKNPTVPDAKVRPNFTDKKIAKAVTVNDLLSINEDSISVSRQHALKIVSVLAQWSASGKVELADFETDPRFIKLCRILSKGSFNKTRLPARSVIRGDDLSMVLGVTGDDEAAKLVASITLPQMIKVMSTLAQKKRRSTPLLRSLAYNISRSTNKLDLKQCADLLYSMTILNFPESLLLERISTDVIDELEKNSDRSAVVGSLLTSLGLLRYKDIGLLDALSEWVLKYNNICRPQDIVALFQTLAVVNYNPGNSVQLYKGLIPQLSNCDMPKASTWLDTIWSLVLLNKASNEHIASVLTPEFIDKLQNDSATITSSAKIKLLNINAATQFLLQNYNGPRLPESSPARAVVITRTKEKQMLVTMMLESLGSLFSSNTYLRSNVNTGMGFLIDGECVVDKKCNPVPVTSSEKSPNHIRIAILAYDYHDTCRGDGLPHGANILATKLLEAQGYKLIIVPYTDFNPRDKIVQRVQYLEKQLKIIVSAAQ